ncbi:hypothetical protein QZJ86_01400 [Methylomonas montana]|uniref:hypothetical protein n=1 Tax=Methylomonas montana TaxID=3058963 RepID=UPI00265B3A37|nr:hypothetical protein [Methylomonas montana]WKJ90820.1 hypothetical protein QZJ86_01400 [Methylomonas montana]
MNKTADRWERFLDPKVIGPSLFLATMFITTFEILKDSVVGRIRGFYMQGWDQNGPTVGPEYQGQVLARNKSTLYASLDWLREHEAIDEADLKTFESLKKTRNQLAHQLFNVVTGQVDSEHASQFPALVALLRKVEVWWVVNVEIPTDPDYDGKDIDQAGIVPGAVLSLQMLIEVASGNTELLEQWRMACSHGKPVKPQS